MKIYEIVKEDQQLNEVELRDVWNKIQSLGSFSFRIAPIVQAAKTIFNARRRHTQGDPNYDDQTLVSIEQTTIAKLVAILAAQIVGSKIISSSSSILKLITFFNPTIGKLINGLASVGKLALLGFLASPKGAEFISNWLAGELFYNGTKIPGGETWQSVIGTYGQKAVDTAVNVVDKVTGGDDQGAKATEPSEPQAPPELKQWRPQSDPVLATNVARNKRGQLVTLTGIPEIDRARLN